MSESVSTKTKQHDCRSHIYCIESEAKVFLPHYGAVNLSINFNLIPPAVPEYGGIESICQSRHCAHFLLYDAFHTVIHLYILLYKQNLRYNCDYLCFDTWRPLENKCLL